MFPPGNKAYPPSNSVGSCPPDKIRVVTTAHTFRFTFPIIDSSPSLKTRTEQIRHPLHTVAPLADSCHAVAFRTAS
jgi:hypothetical protein